MCDTAHYPTTCPECGSPFRGPELTGAYICGRTLMPNGAGYSVSGNVCWRMARLQEVTRLALGFASDCMQQLGWARGQSPELYRELATQEGDAYRLFNECWDALDMTPRRERRLKPLPKEATNA